MYIHEAVALAMEKGKDIRRTTWKRQRVELRNDSRECIRHIKDWKGNDNPSLDWPWPPTADDLMADDWELVD